MLWKIIKPLRNFLLMTNLPLGLLLIIVSQKLNLDSFYSALLSKCSEFSSLVASSSISIIGFIAAIVTIIFSLNSVHINKYKKHGYFHALLVYFGILSVLSIASYVLSIFSFTQSILLIKTLFFFAIFTAYNFLLFFLILVLQMYRSVEKKIILFYQ